MPTAYSCYHQVLIFIFVIIAHSYLIGNAFCWWWRCCCLHEKKVKLIFSQFSHFLGAQLRVVRAFRSSLVEELGEKCNVANASSSSLSLQEKLQRLRSHQQRQQQEEQQTLDTRRQGPQATEGRILNGEQPQPSAAPDASAPATAKSATPSAIDSRPFAVPRGRLPTASRLAASRSLPLAPCTPLVLSLTSTVLLLLLLTTTTSLHPPLKLLAFEGGAYAVGTASHRLNCAVQLCDCSFTVCVCMRVCVCGFVWNCCVLECACMSCLCALMCVTVCAAYSLLFSRHFGFSSTLSPYPHPLPIRKFLCTLQLRGEPVGLWNCHIVFLVCLVRSVSLSFFFCKCSFISTAVLACSLSALSF